MPWFAASGAHIVRQIGGADHDLAAAGGVGERNAGGVAGLEDGADLREVWVGG